MFTADLWWATRRHGDDVPRCPICLMDRAGCGGYVRCSTEAHPLADPRPSPLQGAALTRLPRPVLLIAIALAAVGAATTTVLLMLAGRMRLEAPDAGGTGVRAEPSRRGDPARR